MLFMVDGLDLRARFRVQCTARAAGRATGRFSSNDRVSALSCTHKRVIIHRLCALRNATIGVFAEVRSYTWVFNALRDVFWHVATRFMK